MIDATPVVLLAGFLVLVTLYFVIPEYSRKKGGLIGLPLSSRLPVLIDLEVPGIVSTIKKSQTFEGGIERYFLVNYHHHEERDYESNTLKAKNGIDRTYFFAPSIAQLFDLEISESMANLKKVQQDNKVLRQRNVELERNIQDEVDKRVQQSIEAKKAANPPVKKL